MSEETEWRNIKKWAKAELVKLRNKNESHLNEIDTASIRGEIKSLRALLKIGGEEVSDIKMDNIIDNTYVD